MTSLENVNDDSILIFEYFTASGVEDLSIVSEAYEIIKSIAIDLKDEDTYLLVANQFKNIVKDLDFDINLIILEESLEDWLNKNIGLFKRTMFVAGENDNNLYNLTKLIESKGVKIYGADSFAVKLASDKFETYDYLYNKIPQPVTYNILLNHKTYWKKAIQIFFDKINDDSDMGDRENDNIVPILEKPKNIPILDNLDNGIVKEKKLIAKPRYGVDCDDIKIISSKNDIGDLENIYGEGSRFIVQEYIGGDICSVCLISDGKKAIPISLNKQIVELDENGGNYIGGYVPYEHPLKNNIFNLAKRACEFVPGLKGFVGVDIIVKDNDIYLIEINSRFTTSFVGLSKIININISKTIIDLIDGIINIDDIDEISYNSKVNFSKNKEGFLDIDFVKL